MLFVFIGILVGTIGTLIGVGGGFILVPALLYLYPLSGSVWITAVSLWVVALNSTSGSITYYLKDRIHVKVAVVFILAGLIGALLGVRLGHLVDRSDFEKIFASCLIIYSVFLFFKSESSATVQYRSLLPRKVYIEGAVISFFVGILASFLGIGGGVIHVPLLSHYMGFSVHLATGTSTVILAATAIVATLSHLVSGDLNWRDPVLWQLGLGAVVGAQVGARLSAKVPGRVILKMLSIALFVVGVRLIL